MTMDITELPRMFPPPECYGQVNWASCEAHGLPLGAVKTWLVESPVFKRSPRPESVPLVIRGPLKSGKTVLATAVWRFIGVKKSRMGAWFQSTDLEMVLRAAHSYGEISEMDEWLYMEVCRCPLLAVDDICRLGSPQQEARLLEDLLRHRARLGLATIVTINPGAEVPDAFYQWLMTGTVVTLSGTR